MSYTRLLSLYPPPPSAPPPPPSLSLFYTSLRTKLIIICAGIIVWHSRGILYQVGFITELNSLAGYGTWCGVSIDGDGGGGGGGEEVAELICDPDCHMGGQVLPMNAAECPTWRATLLVGHALIH